MTAIKNTHIKLLVCTLGPALSVCGMVKQGIPKTFQPLSLKAQAAKVIANAIDPSASLANALYVINNPERIPESVAHIVCMALAQKHQSTLRTILQSQLSLQIKIERLNTVPKNLFSIPGCGVYSRSKKDMCDPERADPLYTGIARLNPDPLMHNAPVTFAQVYCHQHSTLYFDDQDEETRPQNSPKIGIWDKKTGDLLNDGTEIQKKTCC